MKVDLWHKIWQEGSEQVYYIKPYKSYSLYAYWCWMHDPNTNETFQTIVNGIYWDNIVELSSLEQELM
jgi:hypothetical protein